MRKNIISFVAGALNITFRVEGNQKEYNKMEVGIFDGEFIKK